VTCYLRVAASAFFLLLLFALLAMWVRSYRWLDAIYWTQDRRQACAGTIDGQLILFNGPPPLFRLGNSLRVHSEAAAGVRVNQQQILADSRGALGFYYRSKAGIHVFIPFWFLTLATAVLAWVTKPHPRWRISLLEALAFSTWAAFAAALLAWLVRLRD
jgi:hypothetical protein